MPHLVSPKVILYFFFLAILDGSVMPAIQIHAVYPSFLCLFICYAAFEWGGSKTVYIAFWAGLLRDLLGGGLIGLDATLLVALALALDFLVQKMERELPGIYYIVTFLFVFCAGALRLLVSYAGQLPPSLVWGYLGMIAMTALYTSALLPVFNFMTNRWFGHSATKQYELFR
ncbi:MAG: rod shape-determining protein MreD [Candidatus Omnitrophica bacterium]|nr:rod shape-determining protein MreD [Candidatus Omnitrophota bacterium]